MEHAATPSLISLGLTTDTSSEGPSFRWGLVSSCALHAFVILVVMFLRFESDSQQPFRTIDVTLISLPAIPTTAAPPKPTPMKKAAVAQLPKKTVPPPPAPTASPKPQPTAPPVEDTLPPLPTEIASERLSESLEGAINSIVVPQKREATTATVPSQRPTPRPSEDSAPLIDNLRLPSAPPTIARPKRLQPAEPLQTPLPTTPPPSSMPQKTQAPLKPPSLPSPPPAKKAQPVIKPAPTLPSLSEVTPFKKPKQRKVQSKTLSSAKIEESLKRNLPTIPTPAPVPNVPKKTRKRSTTPLEPKSTTPQVSAPQLAKIPESPQPTPARPPAPKPESVMPTPPKMSETVKKLMEGLKSTTRMPVPKQIPPQRTKPSTASSTPPIKPPPSEIDQRISKLSIPEVAPVESIEQRLQLLEVKATGNPGHTASKPSTGKNRYLAMVEDRIDRQWVAPPLLASTPVVVLKFHISRSGEISRIHIAESSGHAHYDSAAQRAVQAVNPLPAFPSDISDSFFDVKYRFIKD